MDNLKNISDIVQFLANVLTVIASSIAIYIYFCKKEEVKLLFKVLVNYSYQTTLSEIKEKLDRLNEYNANEPTEINEIRNLLHEIAGQIRGNQKLQKIQPNLVTRIEAIANTKKITEPSKRSLVSEIRELLKNLNVDSIEKYI